MSQSVKQQVAVETTLNLLPVVIIDSINFVYFISMRNLSRESVPDVMDRLALTFFKLTLISKAINRWLC
jgi:hypothetical protein